MSYKHATIGNVYIVRWEHIEKGEPTRVVDDIERLSKGSPTKFNYIAIAPPTVNPPEDDVRTELKDGLKRLVQVCSKVFLVIEQKGFKGSVVRTIAAGMFLLAGKRDQVRPYETLEEALSQIENLTVSMATVVSTARAKNLIA